MSTNLAPAVEMNGLTKRFGAVNSSRVVNAVNGIDLRVESGEIVAFLGPNGAGKTTALDMLLGLSEPTGGTVRVLGQAPSAAVAAGRLSAVLQTGGLLHDMRVGETVRAVAAMHGVSSRVAGVMERADLSGIARRPVGKCSGGEQQRIKFALALLPDPDVLVLDEPTAGMDVGARRRFWDAMREDADQGRTVIFATHYLEEAEQFARRTVLVARGKVVADAPTEQLRASLGGRVVSFSLPGDGPDRVLDVLNASEGIKDVAVDGYRVTLRAVDSDATARLLLNDLGATDLEIVAPTLEAAFTNLTED